MKRADTRVKQLSPTTIGGYGVVFGDAQHVDLEGDYFTSQTDFWLERYKGQPLIYEHAMGELPPGFPDDMPRNFVYGTITGIKPDDVGLWFEAQIDEHNQWAQYVLNLIDKGVLHWSSGSVPHLVKRQPDGGILSWPIIEGSTTATPAEPRQTDVVRLKHYIANTQDLQATPTGAADKAAQGGSGGPVQNPNAQAPVQREDKMAIELKSYLRNICEGALTEHWAAIEKDVKSAVKEGGNAIAEMLQPLADQVAEAVGVSPEEALTVLMELALGNAEAPTEEVPTEEIPFEGEPAAMAADMDALITKKVDEKMKAFQPSTPQGGFLTKKNLNFGRSKPQTLGRFIKALVEKDYSELRRTRPMIAQQYKALGINPDTAGGYLVPVEQSNQIIELLRAEAVVLPLCRQMPMNRDTLSIPKLTGGSTAYWVGENSQITSADPTFGQITLVAKKLAVMVKISNELMEDSDPSIDAIIREDIAREMAEAVDVAILEGSGMGNEPLGLANNPDITKTALNTAPTLAQLLTAIGNVEVANVSKSPDWKFVFHPRLKLALRQIQDTEGQYIWSPLGAQFALQGGYPADLLGFGWADTTNITIDTADNNETNLYFGQWNDVIVGMRKSIELMASNEAGTAFEYDQTWIRAILRMDVNIRHAESIEVLTDVRNS